MGWDLFCKIDLADRLEIQGEGSRGNQENWVDDVGSL